MKTLEQLTLGTDEITGALYADMIADKLIEAAEARRVSRDIVEVNTNLKGNPGVTLVFPKTTTVSFSTHTAGTSLTTTQPTFSTVSVTPILMTAGIRVTYEAINASRFDIIQKQLGQLARGATRIENIETIRALMDIETTTTFEFTEDTDGSETSYTLTGSNIIEILTCTITGVSATMGYDVNYKDGTIKFSSAPGSNQAIIVEARIVGSLTTLEAVSSTILNYNDLIDAKAQVDANDWYADTILIHPKELGVLLKDSSFIDASKYGGREAILRGEIGMIAGMKVLVTSHMPTGSAVVFDRVNAGVLVIKRDFTIETDRRPGADAIDVIGSLKYRAALINPGAVCVITGAQQNDITA